jgi:predicted SAM-dependent methyltransferase
MSFLDRISKRIPTPLLHKIDTTLSRIIYQSGAGQPFQHLRDRVDQLYHKPTADRDFDNLVHSVPLALRNLTRSQREITDSLDGLRRSQGSLNDSLHNALDRVEFALGRFEFVRRELMYEMRHGAKAPLPTKPATEVTARLVSTDKLTAARATGLRLNLGCGHLALDGYLNVDLRELPGVDIVAEAGKLPLENGEVDEIFSAHLLEHFPQEALRRVLLPYWFGLLRPGGTFRTVVPDAEAMIREYSNGRYDYEDMREVMYGAQDYDGDFHFNMFTPASMKQLLEEAGFRNVQLVAAGRRNGRCFEFEVSTTKTSQNP